MVILLMVIGVYFRLNYHWLLVVINDYSINGYWCLFQVKLSLAIDGYSINAYWCLFQVKLSLSIGGY